jgi:hypothetical protein
MHYARGIFLASLVALLAPHNVSAISLPEIQTRGCGTEDPSSTLSYTHALLSWAEPLENGLQNASTVQSRLSGSGGKVIGRAAQSPLYIVDTYIHIIADNQSALPSSPDYVTDYQIRIQFEYLANSFTQASIGFRLRGYTRTINDTWARNGDDTAMKTALRRGSYSALNIYYQARLQSAPGTPGIPDGSILLGFCSLPGPGITATTPAAVYVRDGCNILSGTMPGGAVYGYGQGGSTVHEVGHWNGLLHTFQGNSCGSQAYGDYVADTPQEATSTSGCPRGKDSCPNSGVAPGYDGSDGQSSFSLLFSLSPPLLSLSLPLPFLLSLSSQFSSPLTESAGGPNPYGAQGYSGLDPINNFMDYSVDACYTGFTPGQGARMLNLWQIYRKGR